MTGFTGFLFFGPLFVGRTTLFFVEVWSVSDLFEVDDVPLLIGFEAGGFEDVVGSSRGFDFVEGEFGGAFVVGQEDDGADAKQAVGEGAMESEIDDAEQIEVVDFSAENSAGPFDAVGGDFVGSGFDFGHAGQQDKEYGNDQGQAKDGFYGMKLHLTYLMMVIYLHLQVFLLKVDGTGILRMTIFQSLNGVLLKLLQVLLMLI